ncbi:AbrB/MazE/SpoVT family DNA-binding domain-containing protein [Devosia nitrariae]|uniref:AbrB family transcriptional regulator n=1 Tax=Devosia nitrariae TaxID=2071872 RepID=A0ABQ5WB02_9HYPH|nr:AbrB/MazE/SpoVT family DNA-binding domain-containing protein [Devosia nitrariae]GLQ56806.1 AbrB family transcriptional regulator [Devosia nitrariae]
MPTATVTSKGQITLPKDVRDDLKLRPGDKVEFEKRDGRYVLRPRNRSIMELAGILHRPGSKAMTIEEMDEKLAQALAEDDERIRAGR